MPRKQEREFRFYDGDLKVFARKCSMPNKDGFFMTIGIELINFSCHSIEVASIWYNGTELKSDALRGEDIAMPHMMSKHDRWFIYMSEDFVSGTDVNDIGEVIVMTDRCNKSSKDN